jgi:hypothetical protein
VASCGGFHEFSLLLERAPRIPMWLHVRFQKSLQLAIVRSKIRLVGDPLPWQFFYLFSGLSKLDYKALSAT